MDIRTYMLTKKEILKSLDVKERIKDVKESESFITSIIGPRRSGKTYFIYDLIKKRGLEDEEFILINFEEPVEIKEMDEAILSHHEIYGKEPKYVFLDEVQGMKNWEKHVYSLYERKRYRIFITGSSSKLLSREIATQLRGRAIPIYIYPFSFEEVARIAGINIRKYYSLYDIAKMRNLLSYRLKDGFFPDVVLGKIEPLTFFSEYLDLVIYKDIVERFGIRNTYPLEFFLKYCISSNSSFFSVHKVFNTLKSQGIRISKKTLYSFRKIIEDVSFGFFLKKFDWSRRKIEMSMPKFYLIDNGIYTYFEGENRGRLIENLVFLELVKRGFVPNENIFYWRSSGGEEVDFVLRGRSGIKELLQVTYASSRDEVERRELRSLIKASWQLNCDRLLVITWDYEDTVELEGKKISFVPLWKWISQSLQSNKYGS